MDAPRDKMGKYGRDRDGQTKGHRVAQAFLDPLISPGLGVGSAGDATVNTQRHVQRQPCEVERDIHPASRACRPPSIVGIFPNIHLDEIVTMVV